MSTAEFAVEWLGGDTFRGRDRPRPQLPPGFVEVRPHYVGICGTDLHIVHGTHARARPPLVLGHEMTVTVSSGPHAGALAAIDPVVSCGQCRACAAGQPQICPELRLLGVDFDGGLQSSLAVRPERIHLGPPGVDARTLTLAEPVAIALHALGRVGRIDTSDSVVVLGCGPIGLLIGSCLRLRGIRDVVMCDPEPARLRIATGLGLTVTDPGDAVGSARAGGGIDLVVEAAGAAAAVGAAMRMVRPGGTILLVGVHQRPIEVDLAAATLKEVRLLGTRALAPVDMSAAVALIAEHPASVEPIIGPTLPWSQTASAVAALGNAEFAKILIECPGAGSGIG